MPTVAARIAASVLFAAFMGCSADPGYQGRSSKEWIDELRSADTKSRVAAADALGQILLLKPSSTDVVDALGQSLRDTSDDVRLTAAAALTADGVDPRTAFDGFHALLHDTTHADVRQTMAVLVGRLGPVRGQRLVSHLGEALSDPDAGVRTAAVESLAMFGHSAAMEVAAVSALTRDPDHSVRIAAVQSLHRLGASPDMVLKTLRPALKDSVALVRAAAANAIALLGTAGSPAATDLMNASRDTDAQTSAAATAALDAINGRPAKLEPYAEPSALQRCPPGTRRPGC
jgi:HEAT repeat protein